MEPSKYIKLSKEILDEPTERYCEIYKITNNTTQKVYIGQAVSHILNHKRYRPYGFEGRFRCHISEAFSTKKNQSHYLNNSIRKYGVNDFIVELLEYCTIEDANDREIHYIHHFNSLFPNGYNLKIGGSVFTHSDESKKRLSNGVANYFKDKKYERFNKISVIDDDIEKYIEYNLNDVKIVVALDKKLQFIDLARRICHTGHVGYEHFGTSSRYLEGAILIYLRRQGRVAPNKPLEGREEYEQRLEDGEEGFEGAYVKPPVPGRYDWVFDLDLTSMYPNIIISLNISPETKIAKVENWNAEDFVRGKLTEVILSGQKYSVQDFNEMLVQNNLSVASNGAVYKLPKGDGQEGTIPSILIKWFNERKEMRKLAKKHADAKEWEMYEFYDQRQKVQKILLNSIYGCLGLPVFRFYDKDNAEAVTLSGVSIIKTANMAINQYYKNVLGEDANGNDYVIYVDTDSCFASALPIIKKTMPDIDVNDEKKMTESILKVTEEVQKYVNQIFDVMSVRLFNVKNHRFDVKQEVIAKSSFWLAKKRYCQFIINKGGVECDELEVKGIDVVRTSFPAKFRTFMKQFLIDLLKNVDKETINNNILQFKDDMKNFGVIELAKNTSVKFKSETTKVDYNPKSRQPFQIISGTPAQVKASLYYNDLLTQFNLTKIIPPIFHGQKIKWVYLKQNEYGIECLAMKADGTDPQQIIDILTKYMDRDTMYEQELKSKLVDFYEVLKWEYPNSNWKAASEFFEF